MKITTPTTTLPFLVAVALVGPSVALAAETGSSSSVVEIVTAGPEPERGNMELALRSLLGSDPALLWMGKESIAAAEASPPDETPRIFVDVAHVGEIRIFLPARDSAGKLSIRTVPAQEASQPDAAVAVRETVAQIVGEAVRALRGGPATATAAPPPPTLPPATIAAASQPAASGPATKRKTGLELTLAAGAHTAPFKMAEPSSESNWLGPSVQGQVRWRVGKAAFALRTGWEKSEKSIDYLLLHTQFYSMSLAAFRRAQVDKLDLGIGFELGALYVQQSTEMNQDYPSVSDITVPPGTLRDTRSLGYLFGPIVEANLQLTERWFFHLDFAASINGLNMKAGSLSAKTGWVTSPNVHGLMGLGFRI